MGNNLGINIPVGSGMKTLEGATTLFREMAKEAKAVEKSIREAKKAGKEFKDELSKLGDIRKIESQAREAAKSIKAAAAASKELAARDLSIQTDLSIQRPGGSMGGSMGSGGPTAREMRAAAQLSQRVQQQSTAKFNDRQGRIAGLAAAAYSKGMFAAPVLEQMTRGGGAKSYLTGLTQTESTLLNTGADIGVGAAAYYAGSTAAAGSVLLAAGATHMVVDTYWREKQNALDVRTFEKDVNAGRVNAATGRFFQEEERRFWKHRGLESVAAAKQLASFKGVGIHRFDDAKLTKALEYTLPEETPQFQKQSELPRDRRKRRDVQIASMIKNIKANVAKTLAEERRNPTTLEQYTGAQGETVAGYRYNEEKALANAYENFYKANRNNLSGMTLGDFTTMMTDSMTRETEDGRKQIGYRFNPKGEMWTRPADYRGNMRAPASWDYIWPIEENNQNRPSGLSSYKRSGGPSQNAPASGAGDTIRFKSGIDEESGKSVPWLRGNGGSGYPRNQSIPTDSPGENPIDVESELLYEKWTKMFGPFENWGPELQDAMYKSREQFMEFNYKSPTFKKNKSDWREDYKNTWGVYPEQMQQINEINTPIESITAPGVVSKRQIHTLRNGYGVARTDDDE